MLLKQSDSSKSTKEVEGMAKQRKKLKVGVVRGRNMKLLKFLELLKPKTNLATDILLN